MRWAAGWAASLLVLVVVFTVTLAGAPGGAVPPAAAGAVQPAVDGARAADEDRLRLALTSVTPAVATPGQPVTVAVAVVNAGTATIPEVRVAARLVPAPLVTREQVRRAAGADPPRVDSVASARVADLAPGARAGATITVPGHVIPVGRAYGVYPLALTASDGTASATLTTFLPFQAVKEYEPLTIAFVAPVTPGPDPALVTATGAERAEAWAREIGPSGRLTSLLEATAGAPVTWAIDPAVLAAPAASPPVSRSGGQASPPAAAPTEQDPVDALHEALRARMTRGGNPRWALPPGDPDLAALTRADTDDAFLHLLLSAETSLTDRFDAPVPPRIAWPVGGAPGTWSRERLAAAYGAGGPAAFVVPTTAVDADPAASGPAARTTPEGRALLAFDPELSRLFTATGDAAGGAATTQRFLAETLTLLAEAPGRHRTVLVVADRGFAPDETAVTTLLDGVGAAPWLQVTPADDVLAAANHPGALTALPDPAAPDPLASGPSPLDHQTVQVITTAAAGIRGVSRVLSPVSTSQLVPERATVQALSSTRWRDNPGALTVALRAVTDRVGALTTGVTVLPSTVNFFAEHGALQVTVVNNLDVDVHDVRLVLEPQGRPPRLRVVEDPGPLSIRPRSRTTVRVGVEAVAAGVVPVTTYLATPLGTPLGTSAEVRVRVQPTNGWLVLALGGIVGLVFLAGLYRALRLGSPRVSSEDLKEIDLT